MYTGSSLGCSGHIYLVVLAVYSRVHCHSRDCSRHKGTSLTLRIGFFLSQSFVRFFHRIAYSSLTVQEQDWIIKFPWDDVVIGWFVESLWLFFFIVCAKFEINHQSDQVICKCGLYVQRKREEKTKFNVLCLLKTYEPLLLITVREYLNFCGVFTPL